MVGHRDTVHVRGWKEHWAGTPRWSRLASGLVTLLRASPRAVAKAMQITGLPGSAAWT
jgi:hypothetical protein